MNTEPFKKVLREIIGGRSEAARYRIFRAWWRSDYRRIMQDWFPGYTGEQIKIEPDEIIAQLKQNGVDGKLLWIMKRGIPEWRTRRDVEQRREAAQSRWKKKPLTR
jgi:hypothetical protein